MYLSKVNAAVQQVDGTNVGVGKISTRWKRYWVILESERLYFFKGVEVTCALVAMTFIL